MFHASPAKSPGEFWEREQEETCHESKCFSVQTKTSIEQKSCLPHRPKPKSMWKVMIHHDEAALADKSGGDEGASFLNIAKINKLVELLTLGFCVRACVLLLKCTSALINSREKESLLSLSQVRNRKHGHV